MSAKTRKEVKQAVKRALRHGDHNEIIQALAAYNHLKQETIVQAQSDKSDFISQVEASLF